MKRIFTVIFFSLLILLPTVRAQGPDEQYVTIYDVIQQGDTLNEKGQTAAALAKYSEAQIDLKRFHVNYPDWNLKVVNYRLKYLDAKITELSAPPAPSTNAPAAAPANESTNAPPAATPPATNNVAPTPEPTPTEPPKAAAPPSANLELENRVNNLEEQLRNVESDKALLEAKLKEALSAQPAAVDPQELARAMAQIKELQKQNDLLQVTLDQAKTNVPAAVPAESEKSKDMLAEANRKVGQLNEDNARLALENDALKARVKKSVAPDAASSALLDENNLLKKQLAELQGRGTAPSQADELSRQLKEAQAQIATLQSDKEVLRLQNTTLEDQYKKMAAAGTAATVAPIVVAPAPAIAPDHADADKIAQLEAQRDALQKTVNAVTKDIYGRKKGKAMAQQIDEMTREMATLRARLEVVEAGSVAYTPEELALFSQPTSDSLMASARISARKAARELPASAAVTLSEARGFFVAHDWEKAEAKYLEVLKLDPKNIVVLADLASIQLELGHTADAEKNIKGALDVEPKDDYSLFVLGQIKFREKKYDDAFEALSQAAQLNPQNAKVQNFLGLTLSEKGMRGPAETAFRKAIQYDPSFAQAHENLAVVYATQQPPLLELAKWHYQKALAAGEAPNPGLEKLLDPTNSTASTR